MSSCRRMANVMQTFSFEDRLRSDTREAITELADQGLAMEVLSGDREERVRQLALALGVSHYSRVSPGGKAAHIASIARSGRKVLMVGDGLNDAPALVASHVSMAPASAADVGRNAADLVFLRDSLLAVPQAISVAQNARRLVRENLAIAVGYNAIAMPIAVLGYVTPLVAAVAMSLSSLIVVANALRLGRGRRKKLSKDDSPKSDPFDATGIRTRRMTDFFYLIPIALVLGAMGLATFMWTLKSGQYDDLEGAAERILFNETDKPIVEAQQPSSEDGSSHLSSTN